MTRMLLIDGDITLYEVCLACEYAVDWGDDMWTLHSDLREACQRFDGWVRSMQEQLSADSSVLTFSSKSNWRKTLLPSYKRNRKGKRKPLIYPQLKEYAESAYKSFSFSSLEADDVLGLLAGGFGGRDASIKAADEKIIVTIDKDLLTVPGLHFYYNKPEDGIVQVSEEQADANHLMQAIAGDPVDGYPGCPGLGPVRASRLISENPCWDTVVTAYAKAGLTEDDARLQAQVARILRWGDYNIRTEEVKVWMPKTGTAR